MTTRQIILGNLLTLCALVSLAWVHVHASSLAQDLVRQLPGPAAQAAPAALALHAVSR